MVTRIIVLIIYITLLVGIGVYTSFRAKSYESYNLAGRANNKWIGGISTQSASTSGWILLGLPGAAYIMGFSAVWIIIGWMGGSLFNWLVLARRLRTATEAYDVYTMVEFFEKRTKDNQGSLALVSGVVIIILMIINSSAEIVGCGKLINQAFNLDYSFAVTIGLVIVLVYTFLGGFLAVSWTNLIQGTLMFVALLFAPVYIAAQSGSLNSIAQNLVDQSPTYFQFLGGATGFWKIVALITGGSGIALMYPGYIHSLTGFMAVKSVREIKDSALIATIWGCVAVLGASAIGMLGRSIAPDVADPEQIFLVLANSYLNNAVFAVMAAAVMAAILSSVCAYLIIAAASLGGNIARRFVKSDADKHKVVKIEKVAIVVMALLAYLLALNGGAVFTIAMFAAAGLGAAFGPLVIATIYTRNINKYGATASVITGLVVVMVWFYSGLSAYVFEVFPGFIASSLVLYIVSKATGGPEKEAVAEFDNYLKLLK